MTTDQILRIIQESALLLRHDVNMADLRGRELSNRSYGADEKEEFQRDLIETGNNLRIMFLEYQLQRAEFIKFIDELEFPVLLFRQEGGTFLPEIISRRGDRVDVISVRENENISRVWEPALAGNYQTESGEISFYAITYYDHLVSEPPSEPGASAEHVSPLRRLYRLLRAEKKDIFYILFYALVIGLISLVIPLGIQTTVELVSGGVFFSSIYILIGLIILGVLITGGLQIFQITLVEYLQRRVFTKAAYEFAFRLPRVKNEALARQYAPELVNRFFDIMTIQKGLPKLLIDISSAALQIFFGLVLISLYHPFFVFFGIVLIITLVSIFYFTGPRGLRSSIQESKYKYKVAYWLQELGRALDSFKVAGNSNLPLRKTDVNVNNYLKYRKSHFQVLLSQYGYIVLFKTSITAALLIMGTLLVVQREITLGQFVASEVIIILILASVEKLITYMDVVYDMLTAVDKIGHVTDLPLERSVGVDFPKQVARMPLSVDVKNVNFKYPDANDYSLQNISLTIQAGARVCIAGSGDSGKTTLTQLMTGLRSQFEGSITLSKFSIRDLDLTNLRDRIAKNISPEGLFDGTIMDNISLGKVYVTVQDVIGALDKVGLTDWVNQLPEGLSTPIISGGKGLSTTIVHKLILARCLAKKPSLIVLNDFFYSLPKGDKVELIRMLVSSENKWTLIVVSNDPLIMAACEEVVIMDRGQIRAQGSYRELLQANQLTEFID